MNYYLDKGTLCCGCVADVCVTDVGWCCHVRLINTYVLTCKVMWQSEKLRKQLFLRLKGDINMTQSVPCPHVWSQRIHLHTVVVQRFIRHKQWWERSNSQTEEPVATWCVDHGSDRILWGSSWSPSPPHRGHRQCVGQCRPPVATEQTVLFCPVGFYTSVRVKYMLHRQHLTFFLNRRSRGLTIILSPTENGTKTLRP